MNVLRPTVPPPGHDPRTWHTSEALRHRSMHRHAMAWWHEHELTKLDKSRKAP